MCLVQSKKVLYLVYNRRWAVKIFSEKLGMTEMLAECAISLEMSGHPNFAFVFGMCEPNRLILEFIGNDVAAPTLGDTISNSVKLPANMY